jgi:hypothetical protein
MAMSDEEERRDNALYYVNDWSQGYLMLKTLHRTGREPAYKNVVDICNNKNKKSTIDILMCGTYRRETKERRHVYTKTIAICQDLFKDYMTYARKPEEKGTLYHQLQGAEYLLEEPNNNGFVLLKTIQDKEAALRHALPWKNKKYLYVALICMQSKLGLGTRYLGNQGSADGILDKVAKGMGLSMVVLGSVWEHVDFYKKRGYCLISPGTMKPTTSVSSTRSGKVYSEGRGHITRIGDTRSDDKKVIKKRQNSRVVDKKRKREEKV